MDLAYDDVESAPRGGWTGVLANLGQMMQN